MEITDKTKKILLASVGTLVVAAGLVGFAGEEQLGVISSLGDKGGTWFIFNQFSGFQTKYDPEKIEEGANPNGQNTTVFDGDRIGVRQLGFQLLPSSGTLSVSTTPITSLHTFRKRDGENILLRSSTTTVEYYEEGNDTWEIIEDGFTYGYRFGWADYNINTDLVSYVYFGNSQEAMKRWTGNHTLINGAVAAGGATVVVDSTTGFPTSGTVIYCGVEEAYSSKTATQFNLSGTSDVDCADNRGIAEAVSDVSGAPKGNILLATDNRLFVSGVPSTTQAIFFSVYGDPSSFLSETLVSDGTDTASGIFNLGEGGGGVVAMVPDEGSIYMFKKSTIRKATLTDTTYTLGNLKPFDGRSQTMGALNTLSTFTSGNSVFFVTPDKQIMSLSRVESIDYPQITPISFAIEPTVRAADFTSSTGITFQDKVFFSAKSNSDAITNDAVFVYNLRTNKWDSPIIGWNVADWAIYDDGLGDALYFGDSATQNVYKVIDTPTDHEFDVTANWRSKPFDFGSPHNLKQVDSVFVEGYIADNTTLSISLLLDDDGFTQTYSTEFAGTETDYLFNADSYNLFGFHPFGVERFGSNSDLSGKKKFRVYLNKNLVASPFYTAQLEFASDGSNQAWEVTNFGFKTRLFTQEAKPSLFRIFQ